MSLSFSNFYTTEGEKESVSTIYEILDKTAYHLRQGELLEAVLTLNQTEGITVY